MARLQYQTLSGQPVRPGVRRYSNTSHPQIRATRQHYSRRDAQHADGAESEMTCVANEAQVSCHHHVRGFDRRSNPLANAPRLRLL